MATCEHCMVAQATEIHHIVPREQGGGDEPENLLEVCRACHIAIHKRRGDFKKWGRKGVLTTLNWLVNMRQSPEHKIRVWAKHNPESLAVALSFLLG